MAQRVQYRFSAKLPVALCIAFCLFISFSVPWKDKKIKRIEYYNCSGKVDAVKAAAIFKSQAGLSKAEQFDLFGNLVRENGFNRNGGEDDIVMNVFDNNHHIIEQQNFKVFNHQPPVKTYLCKYRYTNNLLVEMLWYYGSFDSSGFFARNTITYNEQKQKIRDEYIEYNDNAGKETRIYTWHKSNSYTEYRLNKAGKLAEKHFVQLNSMGKELLHKMNFEPASDNDSALPIQFDYTYDRFGNELTRKKTVNGSVVELTKYEYRYENSQWIYRVFYSNNKPLWTQFRSIEYY